MRRRPRVYAEPVEILALYAALVATGNLTWTIWHAKRNQRFDVRVEAGVEGVVVDSGRYELAVTARNLGKTDEAVERMGVRFFDPTAEVMAESTVLDRVDQELKPNRSVRFVLDLASQRFRVGREYQGSRRSPQVEWWSRRGMSSTATPWTSPASAITSSKRATAPM